VAPDAGEDATAALEAGGDGPGLVDLPSPSTEATVIPDQLLRPDAPGWWTGGKGGPLGDSTQTLSFGGAARIFAVHTPPSYAESKGVPLLLHFHGFRNLPAGVQNELKYVWKGATDASGFIAVAPEGLPCPELNMGSNVGCFQEARDGQFVAGLISHLGSLYNIDAKHIYLSGHSGGSYFVQTHGLSNFTVYAGAVEFSGGCVYHQGYMNDCSKYDQLSQGASRKLPLFVAHNTTDSVVPASESLALLQILQTNGHPTQHLDTYDGGSSGHSIDASVVPQVWTWLSGFALP
jgi:poly(3-hydroxybutyrate) depolymerase